MSIRKIQKKIGNRTFFINVPVLDSAGEFVYDLLEFVLMFTENGDIKLTENGVERIAE